MERLIYQNQAEGNRLYENMSEKTKLKLEVLYGITRSLLEQYEEEISRRDPAIHEEIKPRFARQLGNLIFDVQGNPLETDLWSERLVDIMNEGLREGELFSKLKPKHATIEHFYGRSAAGFKLLNLYHKSPFSFKDFCNFLLAYGSYHRTTSMENQAFKRVFKKGAKDWIEAYEVANTKLYEIEFIYDGNKVVRIDKKRKVTEEELRERFKH